MSPVEIGQSGADAALGSSVIDERILFYSLKPRECSMKISRFFDILLAFMLSGSAWMLGLAGPAVAEDDAWNAASQILDRHCARCHQAGKTTGRYKERPAADFGYILDRDTLIDRHRLVPGNADSSQIMVKIIKGDMPKDMADGCAAGTATAQDYCGLTDKESAALHDAINALKPPVEAPQVAAAQAADATTSAAASPQPAAPFVSDRDIIRLISDDVTKSSASDAPNFRYFTFTHLRNAGEPEKALRVYRMALAKLLNSLSSEPDPVLPVAIDPGATVFRVDIRRLGWSRATWDGIVAADPYVVQYNDSQFKSLQTELGTTAPFIRADWFAFSASRPPLYYAILDLPRTKAELQAKLGVNVERDFGERRVERAGFQLSGVSDNNRMVERHAISTGAYWESYDFGANGDRKSLFEFPLGPPGAFGELSDRFGFVQDGGEIIFNLPNGLHGYYLTDGKGNRLDVGPTRIVRDPSQRDSLVTNGISCMGCHDKGIKFNDRRPGQPLDQVRGLVEHSGSYPFEAKEIVTAIFPEGQAFDQRLAADAKHYADALTAAAISVSTKLDGTEMVNALSKRFEDTIDARLAAAELGLTEAAFMEKLDEAGGSQHDLKLRLQQDLVPRDQFVALFAQLVNAISDNGDKAVALNVVALVSGTTPQAIAQQVKKPPQITKTFDLAFVASATTLKIGDLVTFALQSEQPCFLTLLDVDDKGRTTVLFPNGFHPDGRIEANTRIEIPGPSVGGFRIRAPEPGTDRVTATCNASFPDVGQQDFSKVKFSTYASTRSLLQAQSDQQRRVTRSLAIEGAGPPGNASVPSATPQLIANPIEPAVPIAAQKSVVLTIIAH